MAYLSRVYGRIELEMNHNVLRVPEVPTGSVVFVLENGRVAIVPADEEPHQAYRLEEDLKTLRNLARFAGTNDFEGYVYRVGEDDGDIERFSFAKGNHALHIERAILAWPDGAPVVIDGKRMEIER